MTYPIIPELYGIVARKLLDEIGEKSFYSGSFSFDYGSKECRFVASIVIYRSKECLPEGDADRIDDLVPVWWLAHLSRFLHSQSIDIQRYCKALYRDTNP